MKNYSGNPSLVRAAPSRLGLPKIAARIETELTSTVKSEFIANTSHELRAPLNTHVGFAKLARRAVKPPPPTPSRSCPACAVK